MARNHEGPFAALEFDVPVGRLGDEVVYLLEGGAATERRGLLVEGVNKTHDRFGALRKTLQVLRTGEHASDVLSRLDLDLATRDVIRSRALWLPRAGDQISDVQLGPSSPYVSLPVNLTEVRFQGVHLRLGDDHSARLFDAERAALVRLGPRDFDYVARVDRSGTWNGTPALGVASTLRYSFGAGVGASSVVVDEVVWWTATHAYPVEMERTLTWTTASERGSNRSTWILIGLKAGTEPIPWDASGVTTAGQSAAPLERAAGSALEDGRKTRMAFSLREALASIEADKTLVDFQAWKQSHANARIVHLEFSGGVWADETSWLVVWLEAPGSAFSVLSVKTGGSVANHDRTWPLLHEQVFWSSPGATTWTGQPAAEIRWPDHPITIAAADELARLHVPSKWHDSGLGYFVWGPYTRSNEPGPDLRMFLYYRAVDNSRFTAIVDSNQGTVDMLWQRTFPAQGRSLTWLLEPAVVQQPRTATSIPDAAPNVVLAGSAAASLLGLFAVLFGWPWIRSLLGAVPAYAKLDRHEVESHPLRQHIVTLLHEHPGLDATGVAQRTLAGWSTVIYHLGVLTRNGVIVRLPDGRHRRFFPTNQGKPAERRQVAVLQNSRSGSILQHLRASGALPRSALAAREGVTVPAILWHLRRLQDVGLVTQRTDGNRIVYVAESGATPSTPFSKPEGSGAVAS